MTLKNHSLAPTGPAAKIDPLEGKSERELLELRNRIDAQLKTDISRLNLAEELSLQYRAGMILLNEIQGDSQTPANQKAQVFNSVSKMLQDIFKSQKIAYSAERLKRYEAAFMKVLGKLGAESARTYFDLYGEFLKNNEDAMGELKLIDPEIDQ